MYVWRVPRSRRPWKMTVTASLTGSPETLSETATEEDSSSNARRKSSSAPCSPWVGSSSSMLGGIIYPEAAAIQRQWVGCKRDEAPLQAVCADRRRDRCKGRGAPLQDGVVEDRRGRAAGADPARRQRRQGCGGSGARGRHAGGGQGGGKP